MKRDREQNNNDTSERNISVKSLDDSPPLEEEYAKTFLVNEKVLADPLDEFGVADRMNISKTLVIRKTELMAKQYTSVTSQVFFLFAAFLSGLGTELNSQLRSNYSTYATNSYKTHSLLSTVSVASSICSAGALTIYARLSDIFGRITLYLSAMMFFIVGTIIQSQATNIQKYAAGTIFYSLGTSGLQVMMFIILSDFSSMNWRLFYTFVPTLPGLITNWITGSIVDRLDPVKHWSWGIAMWAFILPLSASPFISYLCLVRLKASRTEEWKVLASEKTYYQTHGIVQTLNQLFWKTDFIGLVLIVAILGCILVPLTLAGGVSSQWHNPRIISPFILGFVMIGPFIYWESKFAKSPIAPFKILKDRGIWSSLFISAFCKTVYYLAAGYLLTILMVAVNQSRGMATIITNIWQVVACGFAPFFSYFIVRIRRLKPFVILGCSLWLVSMGLLFRFRSGEDSKGGIIGGMVLWGIASTMVTRTVVISIQSITSHDHLATITALSLAVSKIGSGIGSAVSGAIWTQLLYKELLKTIGDPDIAKAVYESPLTEIRTYKWGTPTREAIVKAYRYVQKYEVLIAIILVVPLFLASCCLRDPILTDEVAQTNLKEGEYLVVDNDDFLGNWIRKQWKKLNSKVKGNS